MRWREFGPVVSTGFTLIEVAIVLALLGLLLGGLTMSLTRQVEQRRVMDTQRLLEEAREAVLGYAVSRVDGSNHSVLPCPDITNDGREDRIPDPLGGTGTACANAEGLLPWQSLGLNGFDAWDHRFRYRVSVQPAPNTLGQMRSITQTTCGVGVNCGVTLDVLNPTLPSDVTQVASVATCPAANILAQDAVAVIVSHGANGRGAVNNNGIQLPLPTGANEAENTNGNTCFVSREFDDPAYLPNNPFDDQVVWISGPQLFNRLIAAGRLP